MVRIIFTGDLNPEDGVDKSIAVHIPHVAAGLHHPEGMLIFPPDYFDKEEGPPVFAPEDELELVRGFKRLTVDDANQGCLVLPPGHDVLSAFSYPVVGDKTSFLRALRDTFSLFCDPKSPSHHCPVLVVGLDDFMAIGTAVVEDNLLNIRASRSWWNSENDDVDLYSISLDDERLVEVSFYDKSAGPVLENDMIKDIQTFSKKMLKMWGLPFSMSWFLPEGSFGSPKVLSSSVSAENFLQAQDDEYGAYSADEIVTDVEDAKVEDAAQASIQSDSSPQRMWMQPTAMRITVIGNRPPGTPPWIGQFVESPFSQSEILDRYILWDGSGEEKTSESVGIGRLFIISSPEKVPLAREKFTHLISQGTASLLVHVTKASHAFLEDNLTDIVDGAFIDDLQEENSSPRMVSMTVETLSSSLKSGIIVVNASRHFWSEDFLRDMMMSGVHSIAVSGEYIASASFILAGLERRLLLQKVLEVGNG